MTKVVRCPTTGQAGGGTRRVPELDEVVYIAIDMARSKWVYTLRWAGQEQRRLSTPGALHHLQALVNEYRAAGAVVQVAYEACGFGYEIAWWLQAQGVHVLVVAPSTVERAPGRTVKTDRVDAGMLARKLEQGLLKGAHIPTRPEHERRQLSRTYAQLVTDRKRAQARVRSLLQEQGRIGPAPNAGWTAYAAWLARQDLAAPVTECVMELLAQRTQAAASARRLHRALHQLARLPEYAPLVTALAAQPGVGWLSAIRVLLEVGDITRFATADSFAHYLGLTPSEYSSGETVRRGAVRKCGPGALRTWLLQCAWACVRGGRDAALRQGYERLLPRVGKKRAIVAVTRRLALRLRARWLEAVPAPAQAA